MNDQPMADYGIHNERSDVRAHVSVTAQTVYVFKTEEGIKAIERYKPPLVTAYQPGVKGATSKGWVIKPEKIEDMRWLWYPGATFWEELREDMTTSEKGEKAVGIVLDIMKRGHFPVWIQGDVCNDMDHQREGVDVILYCNNRVQVKCDFRAGTPGTGNLFLQKSERNPLKRY